MQHRPPIIEDGKEYLVRVFDLNSSGNIFFLGHIKRGPKKHAMRGVIQYTDDKLIKEFVSRPTPFFARMKCLNSCVNGGFMYFEVLEVFDAIDRLLREDATFDDAEF